MLHQREFVQSVSVTNLAGIEFPGNTNSFTGTQDSVGGYSYNLVAVKRV